MRFLTLDKVADELAVNVKTVRALIASGKLVAQNVGAGKQIVYRVDPAELQAYLERGRVDRRPDALREPAAPAGAVIGFRRAWKERKSLART